LETSVLEQGDNWLGIASHLPKRSPKECKARWNELQALAKEENVCLVVSQPKWWDELPLVPFMEICKYLDYKQVFGRMTRVCKHFNELLILHKVEFESIELDPVTPLLLCRLAPRISWCKELIFKLNDWTKWSKNEFLVSDFVDAVKGSVTRVDISCERGAADSGLQQLLMPLLNNGRIQ
jgi:hypothetical protein